MFSRLKTFAATRVWRFLSHWGRDVHVSNMAVVIKGLRRLGVSVGNDVVVFNLTVDPLYPHLIEIGNHVTITHATLLTHDDSSVITIGRRRVGRITIGNRVFIGWGSIILPGVSIGDGAIIGAGSVVTRDIPAGVVAAGCPARTVRSVADFAASVALRSDVLAEQVDSNTITDSQYLRMLKEVASRFGKETSR